MDIENLRKIFEEVQKECLKENGDCLKSKISEYVDENGKIGLIDAFVMFHQISFEQNAKFTWEVIKRIEENRK